MRRRWTIKAHPKNSDPFPVAVAKEINARPKWYWTRWGAQRAKRFYDPLDLLVMLWVAQD